MERPCGGGGGSTSAYVLVEGTGNQALERMKIMREIGEDGFTGAIHVSDANDRPSPVMETRAEAMYRYFNERRKGLEPRPIPVMWVGDIKIRNDGECVARVEVEDVTGDLRNGASITVLLGKRATEGKTTEEVWALAKAKARAKLAEWLAELNVPRALEAEIFHDGSIRYTGKVLGLD